MALDVPVEGLGVVPTLVRQVALRPLAAEGLGQVGQHVPLAGVQLAGQHVVDGEHVAAMALHLQTDKYTGRQTKSQYSLWSGMRGS